MAQEPILVVAEPHIEVSAVPGPGFEQPAPTAEQERLTDDVFSQGAAALLALQAGASAVALIADNSASKPLPAEVPPRLPPERK